MTWALALAALKANCVLAAADVSPVIPLTRIGEPDECNQDTIALWPIGSRLSHTGGMTLSLVHLERGVMVKAYLRGSIRAGSIDETLEARLVALEEALFTRIWADASCGGYTIGLSLDTSDYGWEVVEKQLARTLTITVWLDLPSIATIAL